MTEEQKDIVYRLHNSIIKAIVDMDIEKTWDIIQKALKQQPSDDCISRQEAIDIVEFECDEWTGLAKEISKQLRQLPSVTPSYNLEPYSERLWKNAYGRGKADAEQTKWIPVSERVAEFPCLACDIFEQIFIPCGIVVLDSRCYDGKDFAFDVEKFLRGKEIILCGGKKAYEKPREIVAWMPLPEPYKAESEKE